MKTNSDWPPATIKVVLNMLLKTGKVKGVRFDTLEALCRELNCKPGEYWIIKQIN
jgi:DNA-binding Xre family transcriptional regulator